MDLVDTLGLEEALAVHIREMLFTALEWGESTLLFEDQELPDAPAEDLTLRCSTPSLILELVRRIPDRDTVRRALGDLDRPPVAGEGVPSRLHGNCIGPAETYLLSEADGQVSARSLTVGAPLPQEALERSLLGLVCIGLLRFAPRSRVKIRKRR
jgi:hypothetical protein